ncbi:hypothetical protein D3C78_1564920 [compost metagenome]
MQLINRAVQAACRVDHRNQQQYRAYQHHQPLHGIVQHAGTEAAKRGVQRNTDTKYQQASVVRNARRSLEQTCAADKLDRHRPKEGDQQT